MTSGSFTLNPERSIRRFDIFAEYNRLKRVEKGMDEPHAKGYGLWIAKVVASGGSRRASGKSGTHTDVRHEEPTGEEKSAEQRATADEQEWHELSGQPQTDELFDHEIIQRMGADFYAKVFAPAIAQAVDRDTSYESIRDTLRKDWKPVR